MREFWMQWHLKGVEDDGLIKYPAVCTKKFLSVTNGEIIHLVDAKEVEELRNIVKSVLWINECRCDEAYTSRKMHEPNALCGELDDLEDWYKGKVK
jgi:hypothetical protein